MDPTLIWLLSAFGVVVVLGLVGLAVSVRANQETRRRLLEVFEQHHPTGMFVASAIGMVGLVEDGRRLFAALPERGGVKWRVFLPAEVRRIQVVVDSQVVSEGRTGGVTGRVLVGAALLGPLGAIAGASSGRTTRTTHQTSIVSVDLKVTFSDMAFPIVSVRFAGVEKAEEWLARLEAFSAS